MAKRTVAWTQTAENQRRAIFKYWTTRNGSTTYVEKLLKQIKKRVEVIKQFPEAGTNTDFPNTRAISLEHFSIFYTVTADCIYITAFWDNRQSPKELLKLLSN